MTFKRGQVKVRSNVIIQGGRVLANQKSEDKPSWLQLNYDR